MTNVVSKLKARFYRKKAKELLKNRPSGIKTRLNKAGFLNRIHKLEAQQIELELKNKELIRAKKHKDEIATEKYIELYDSVPVGYYILSRDGEIIELNLSGSQMLDKERSLLKNSNFSFYISNDTKQFFDHFLEKVFKNKAKETCEVTLSINDNLQIYVQLTGIIDRNGGKCNVTMTNITEHKIAEEALQETEELYHQILDNSLDAILLTSPDGKVFSANPAACKMLQMSEKEICNFGRNRILVLDDPRLPELMEERKNTGKARGEVLMLRKDGTKFPAEISSSVFTDKNGQLKTSMVIRDITDRKQVEDYLRLSENRFRQLFENMYEGYAYCQVIVENESVIDWTYLEVNDKYEKLTGFKDVIGRRASEICPGIAEIDPQLFEIYSRVSLGGQSEYFEKFAKVLQKWFSVAVYSPGMGYFIVIFNDISKRKKTEDKLKNANKALAKLYSHQEEAKEIERKAISREIHDELGQLLSALKIDLSWIINNPDNTQESRKRLKGMYKNIDETIGIVQRISAELRPSILDDLGLIPALEWYCQNFEKRAGVKVQFKSDGVNCTNEHKNVAIYRILQEALTNVIRHAKAKSVIVHLHQEEGFIILEVIDDGVGMDQDKIDSYNSLGLIGMRERVNLYNGSMDIASVINEGTKLSVIIPLD